MSFLFYFFFAFAFHTTLGYDIKKIDGIKGALKILLADRDKNIYCVTEDSTFYKLNSDYEVILSHHFDEEVTKMFLTPFVHVWFITPKNIYIMKPGSTNIKHATNYQQPNVFGCYKEAYNMDYHGNLLYNCIEGVCLMKYDAVTPVLIENLEYNYMIDDSLEMDENGDLYMFLARYEGNQCKYGGATIRSTSLKELSPTATPFSGPSRFYYDSNQSSMSMNPCFLSHFDGDLFCGYCGTHARLLYASPNDIQYSMTLLLAQPSFKYFSFYPADKHFYLFGMNSAGDCFLNIGSHVTDNGNNTDVHRVQRTSLPYYPVGPSFSFHKRYNITQIKMPENSLCSKDTRMVHDVNDNLFMASTERIYKLEDGGMDVVRIYPFEDRKISAIIMDSAMDLDDNLWILAKNSELYLLSKNSNTPERVPDSNFKGKRFLKYNIYTGDLLIGCGKEAETGLYVLKQ